MPGLSTNISDVEAAVVATHKEESDVKASVPKDRFWLKRTITAPEFKRTQF
jgi:hypothetical protein